MDKKILLFGLLLWVIGFAVSMIVWLFVPVSVIGWYVMAVMLPATIIISWKIVDKKNYMTAAVSWLAVAVVLDFILLVTAFRVQNYYDADVMIYYILTFAMPFATGMYKKRK